MFQNINPIPRSGKNPEEDGESNSHGNGHGVRKIKITANFITHIDNC